MSVGEIIKAKGADVETIQGDASVADAVDRLRDEKIGALVVSSDGKAVDGILSERDVITGLADHRDALLSMKVSDLMTTSVRTISRFGNSRHRSAGRGRSAGRCSKSRRRS